MFKSKRLKYRELSPTDFDLFCELYTNDNVMRYAFLDTINTTNETKIEFRKTLSYNGDASKGTQYVAELAENDVPIGIVDYDVIVKLEKGGIFEIGYFIKPEYWSQGFGFEMSSSIIDFLFINFNIHKIMATCNYKNNASVRIMQKLGMTNEGVNRRARFKNNIWDDELIYSILREEWKK